jgi:Reverse transcriptase (RNA-dependent DNA polymerase).
MLPTAKLSSIRMLTSLATRKGWTKDQSDVATAYLNATLPEGTIIYVRPPFGFERADLVWKLRKAIYGLRQSANAWNHTLHEFLIEMGFVQSVFDKCVYFRKGIHLALVVDDVLSFCETTQIRDEFVRALNARFPLSYSGPLTKFVGIEFVSKEDGSVVLHQQRHVDKILKAYNMEKCNTMDSPMAPGILEKRKEDEEQVDFPLRELVGSLLYLAKGTRPDIAYPVGVLSRYVNDVGPTHVTAAKRILRYLAGTKNMGITFSPKANPHLEVYSDASYAEVGDRKSTSGNIYFLNGGPIDWFSKKQSTVSLSTTEAEYVALAVAAADCLYYRQFLQELGFQQGDPTTVYEDNQSVIDIVKEGKESQRLRHLDVKYRFTHEKIVNKEIDLVYCPSKHMIADMLTKALNPQQHAYMLELSNFAFA